MAGRRPKSLEIRIAQGNPGKRALGKEPPRVPGIPVPPPALSAEARAFWDEIVQTLNARGQLGLDSGPALVCLVRAWDMQRRLEAIVEAEGHTVVIRMRGIEKIRKHWAVRPLQGARRSYLAWLREFGLTPATSRKIA